MTRKVDALIVTALKLEFEQVLRIEDGAEDEGWSEERGPLGLDVAFRSFRGEGGTLRVAVTWATDMGMVAASTAAIPLMERYQPRCIAMCGVCAGRPGKVELGDVIVADRLWTYDAGKLVREKGDDGKEVERFQGDVLTYNLLPDWKQRAERFVVAPSWSWLKERPVPYLDQERWALGLAHDNRLEPGHPERATRCPDWSTVLQRLWDKGMLAKGKLTLLPRGKATIERERLLHPDGFGDVKPFAVHVGPIGTGNKVVEDPTLWGRLSESIRKVLGLEMEACAIGAIAHAQVGRNVRAIVMKGVMDVANPDRDDRYKTFAARASAEVLVRFLRKHLEPAKEEPAPALPPKTEDAVAAVVRGPIHLAERRSEQGLLGRDELLVEVRRALDDDANRGVALHGMSGVGKTSIAETIAGTDHERGLYPGGVFEVAGTSEGRFLSGLAALAGALGTPEGVSEEQKVGVARQRLAQATQRTLLVIDDLEATAPWVERELRPLPACIRILATLTFWPSGFLSGPGRARWIEVPALSPAGASALVRSFAPFLTDAEVTKLNAFFEGHTLGLEYAARTLVSEPMLGVGGYLASIEAARDRGQDGATGVERSALSALRVLWDHLPEAARRAWAMCGTFGNAPVPDGWLDLALSEATMNEADARAGIGVLLKRHLATRVIEGEEVSLRFHPLVHVFARSVAGPADRQAMATGLTRWFEGTWDNEANLTLKARLTLPHVEPAWQNGGDDLRVVRRLAVALRLNLRQESLDSAITMLRSALSRARDDQTEERDAIEWVRHELARILFVRRARDQLLEAEELLRSALRLREPGTDTPTRALSVTLNDLGHVLRALGGGERLAEAEQLLRRAIRMEETDLGGGAPALATRLGTLAMVLKDLGGHERLAEAEQLLRRALRMEETALGSDALTLGARLSNLATVLQDLGGRERLAEAEQLLRRAIRTEETALGSDAPTLGTRLNNLAMVLQDLGGRERLAEAEQLLRRALTIDRLAFPDGSRITAVSVGNLAALLRRLGGQVRIREAQRLEGSARKGGRRSAAASRKR